MTRPFESDFGWQESSSKITATSRLSKNARTCPENRSGVNVNKGCTCLLFLRATKYAFVRNRGSFYSYSCIQYRRNERVNLTEASCGRVRPIPLPGALGVHSSHSRLPILAR